MSQEPDPHTYALLGAVLGAMVAVLIVLASVALAATRG